MTNSKVLPRILKLYRLFTEGQIKTLAQHEVNPGFSKEDRLNYIYFTLPVCLNFQRSSPAMWQSALKTWNDEKTNYLFYPEKIVETEWVKIQADLLKHKLALQKNKHTDIWVKISTTLNTHFGNDPRNILIKNGFDVSRILKFIQGEKKEWFPYLKGLKMANYWLYILNKYTNANLKNMHLISIIPDTHVIKSSIKLGLIKDSDPKAAVEACSRLLKDSPITPVEMHSVLWNWSRNNFMPKV